MGPTDEDVRFRWIATALLGAIAAGGAIDLVLDRPTTLWGLHVLFEVAMLTLTLYRTRLLGHRLTLRRLA